MRTRYILVLTILFFAELAMGQFSTIINPANVGDPRLVLSNPAGAADMNSLYLIAGYQNLYSGLADPMSSTMVGVVYPTARFGAFSVTGQNFHASLLSRSAIDLRYAYHFDHYKTSIGVNFGSLMISYDRGGFQLVDADDPLLSGDLALNTFNMGLGISSQLPYHIRVGLTLDHINRPSMALGGGFRKDIRVSAGLMTEFGHFKPMFLWERDDAEKYVSFGAEYWFPQIGGSDVTALARGFLAPEQFTLGAGLLVKNIRLDYLFDYPLTDLSAFAGATHQFVAAYSFGKTAQCEPPQAICVVGKKILQADVPQHIPNIDLDKPNFPIGQSQFERAGQRYFVLNYREHPYTNFMFFDQNEELDSYSTRLLANLVSYAQKHPYVNLSLTSYFYKNDIKDKQLAEKRANIIADVLARKIAKNRIKTRSIENLQFNSKPNDTPVVEEHRRVKIELDQFSLFRSADSICTFDLSHSQAACGWKSWLLGVYRIDESGQKKLMWHASGKGQPGEKIRWNWTRSLTRLSDLNKTYFCTLRIEDRKGHVAVSPPDQFYIEYQPSVMPTKYVLLFDVDTKTLSAEKTDGSFADTGQIKLDAETKELLNTLADFEITGSLDIEQIIGYTDTTGIAAQNQQWSQQQAEVIHRYLTERGAAIDRAPVGMGENPALQLFPSDTPQGRLMNRRVEILVRPAVK